MIDICRQRTQKINDKSSGLRLASYVHPNIDDNLLRKKDLLLLEPETASPTWVSIVVMISMISLYNACVGVGFEELIFSLERRVDLVASCRARCNSSSPELMASTIGNIFTNHCAADSFDRFLIVFFLAIVSMFASNNAPI